MKKFVKIFIVFCMISLSLLSVLSVNSIIIEEALDVTEENSDQLDDNEAYITGY